MKPGDLVKFKCPPGSRELVVQYGTFIGLRTFPAVKSGSGFRKDYTCAEVMWFNRSAPNGDPISTIQLNLIEVVNGN